MDDRHVQLKAAPCRHYHPAIGRLQTGCSLPSSQTLPFAPLSRAAAATACTVQDLLAALPYQSRLPLSPVCILSATFRCFLAERFCFLLHTTPITQLPLEIFIRPQRRNLRPLWSSVLCYSVAYCLLGGCFLQAKFGPSSAGSHLPG